MIEVSIIIPMYNVAHFLEKCVGSVMRQDLKSSGFEILMVDDGSPDNSYEVACKLAENNSNINVYTQENKGLGGARNTGMYHASGKYLIFLDADDILIDNSLSSLIQLSNANSLDILEFGATQIDETGNTLSTIVKSTNGNVYNGIEYYERVKYMNSACNKVYLTSFVKNNNLEFTEKIYAEDFEFNTRSFFFAQRMMATDKLGASFLQSSGSITRNKDKAKKDKFIQDFIRILGKVSEFKKQEMVADSTLQNKYFEQRMAMCNLGLFYFMFKNGYSYKEMKAIKKELQSEELYRVNVKVPDKNRELFRKILLKNFFLFKVSQAVRSNK